MMQRRKLGSQGLEVSELGLGCMGMSEFYGTPDEEESVATIHRAIELGVDFLDTADMYGPFTNERLVGHAIADRRERVTLATKFGNQRGEDGSRLGVNGRPEYVRQSCEDSLRRLAWITSTSTTSTGWTTRCRSKRPGARWASSSQPGKCVISASPRPRPRL